MSPTPAILPALRGVRHSLLTSMTYLSGFSPTALAPNAPGERRPTGTEPRMNTEPTLWAVRSTGWLDAGSAGASAWTTSPYARFFQYPGDL